MVVLSTSLDRSNQRLMIEFACGAVIGVPISRLQSVRKLTENQLERVAPSADGDGIEWTCCGVRVSVKALRDSMFSGKSKQEQAA